MNERKTTEEAKEERRETERKEREGKEEEGEEGEGTAAGATLFSPNPEFSSFPTTPTPPHPSHGESSRALGTVGAKSFAPQPSLSPIFNLLVYQYSLLLFLLFYSVLT